MTIDAPERVIGNALQNLQSNADFEVVISRLLELTDRNKEEYDASFLPADFDSITRALNLIYRTGLRLGKAFPRALVGPSGAGGLSVEWRRPIGSVKLIVAPGRCDIFHSFDGQYDIEPATDDVLADWLRKFI